MQSLFVGLFSNSPSCRVSAQIKVLCSFGWIPYIQLFPKFLRFPGFQHGVCGLVMVLVWVPGWCSAAVQCSASMVLGGCGDLVAGFGAISCDAVVAEFCRIVRLTVS